MAEFPYSITPANVKRFFEKIHEIGVPKKITLKYIEGLGFKSKNDRVIPGILKKLNFIDNAKMPTNIWKKYRDKKQAPKIMAHTIRETYSKLFDIYPDACERNDDDLLSFFTSHTTVGEKARKLMVSTFKILCGLSDFKIPKAEVKIEEEKRIKATEIPTATGLTINVNIQFTLPETHDISIYDKIFESLKNNILSK